MAGITKGISRQCADFVSFLSFSDLDQKTVAIAKKCIIDWLGCVLGGSSTPAASIIESLMADMGGKSQATFIGSFNKGTTLQAAMVNAYNCHILEMDDVHKSSISHPAAPVISAAFSLAEYLESSGKDLIEAIVAGYDVMIRIGEAVSPSHYAIWHTTSTCGAFGAAAATAKLLHLDEVETLYSLGNAGTQAAGFWEFATDKAMTKYLHCGKAAYNGLISSLMSKKGFTGATRILEGDRGFFRACSTETNFSESFKDMGQNYRINETVYKPYASCRHTHGPINATLELRDQKGFSYEDVEDITVETYDTALRLVGNTDFSTSPAAKFCLPYCLASALVFGKVGVTEFKEEKLKDPRIKRIVPVVKIMPTDEINSLYPSKWASRITIKTIQGDLYSSFIEYPKGDPENTMTDTEIEDKYLELATLKVEKSKALELLQKCRSIENCDNLKNFFV